MEGDAEEVPVGDDRTPDERMVVLAAAEARHLPVRQLDVEVGELDEVALGVRQAAGTNYR